MRLVSLILICLLSFASAVLGETRFVSKQGSAESPFLSWETAARDLESALDTAEDGDVIVVGPGTYAIRQTIVIRKAITITNADHNGLTILNGSDAPRNSYCFEIRSSKAIVAGMTITRFGGGIRFNHGEGTSAVARNCVIVNNDGHGIFFNHGGCAKNCTIAFNRGVGLYAYDMGGGGDSPSNLILYRNKSDFVRESANIVLKNSSRKNPGFISKDDFRLRSDSHCIDAGNHENWMNQSLDAGGLPRIQNDRIDLGAHEYQPSRQSAGNKSAIQPPSTDAARKAVEKYVAEIAEIEQVANMRKRKAKERLMVALKQLERFDTEKGKRFRGMLGSYFDHQGRIPFIMLSVPNGENVLGESYRKTLNAAEFDSSTRLYKFLSEGYVSIPKDGSYRIRVSRAAGVKLNGTAYRVGATVAGQPPYADVELKTGVYRVSFSVGNNGGQLGYAMIQVLENQNKTELPIFVYESDLDVFTNDLSLGVHLRETTGWSRKENQLDE